MRAPLPVNQGLASAGFAVIFVSSCLVASAVSAGDDLAACQSDAMIVFDASGSMSASDYSLKVPRIARLKQAMEKSPP